MNTEDVENGVLGITALCRRTIEHAHHIHEDIAEMQSSVIDLPIPTTRSYVETGQLTRKEHPTYLKTVPSPLILGYGLSTESGSACDTSYDGGMEDQRQYFQQDQMETQKLTYSWKGKPCVGNEETPKMERMSEEVQPAELVVPPQAVHHFNWLGRPVQFKSTTPPSVSFAIIISLQEPRGLTFGSCNKDLYKAVLFNNALQTVDPVCYDASQDHQCLSSLRGTRLQEAVDGCVSKFYSKHGDWHNTDLIYDDEDQGMPYIDSLCEEDYDANHLILNGWFENHNLPTVRNFVEMDSAVNKQLADDQQLAMILKIDAPPTRSHLDQVVHRHELEVEDSLDMHAPSKTSSPQSSITGCRVASQQYSPPKDELLIEHWDWADESDEIGDLPPVDEDWVARLMPPQVW